MSSTPTSNGQNGTRQTSAVRWAGVVVTIVFAAGAMTIQWGVVTTRLAHMEKRLDAFIVEARSLRTEYHAVERRLSYVEGRLNGPLLGREGP